MDHAWESGRAVCFFPECGSLHAQVLQFVHQCAAQLAEAGDSAEMALQLFLTAAQSASGHARLDIIAYEFFEQVRWHFSPDKGGEHHHEKCRNL